MVMMLSTLPVIGTSGATRAAISSIRTPVVSIVRFTRRAPVKPIVPSTSQLTLPSFSIEKESMEIPSRFPLAEPCSDLYGCSKSFPAMAAYRTFTNGFSTGPRIVPSKSAKPVIFALGSKFLSIERSTCSA